MKRKKSHKLKEKMIKQKKKDFAIDAKSMKLKWKKFNFLFSYKMLSC